MKTVYSKAPFKTKGWEREEHFHFFRSFTQPFFNVHTQIDITKLYHHAKWECLPVSLVYLHAAAEGARATENFLLRLEGDEVVKYEAVDISTTVLKDNKTVSFVHLPHHPDLHTFCQSSSEIIAEVKKSNKLFCGYSGPDLIHATTLPWFDFKGMEHAHTDDPCDSIPKLAFGRLEWKGQQAMLPVSVRVHHALADGYHIHLFLENMKRSVDALGSSVQAPFPAKDSESAAT
ncbi:CatA-like O-acetyltransferase [Pontibacter harenae]|uniref:CatA-like O-acetyltransferase n=1 Tax=Pontibacter harenae TaxID=2894083 RepID=UPI001E337F17|nr:CatA-like O-acetyltransferase [Pontibacter harenae]MCC9168817.1 chloramphenicol acetyltransferase [Pontibacter harenae]